MQDGYEAFRDIFLNQTEGSQSQEEPEAEEKLAIRLLGERQISSENIIVFSTRLLGELSALASLYPLRAMLLINVLRSLILPESEELNRKKWFAIIQDQKLVSQWLSIVKAEPNDVVFSVMGQFFLELEEGGLDIGPAFMDMEMIPWVIEHLNSTVRVLIRQKDRDSSVALYAVELLYFLAKNTKIVCEQLYLNKEFLANVLFVASFIAGEENPAFNLLGLIFSIPLEELHFDSLFTQRLFSKDFFKKPLLFQVCVEKIMVANKDIILHDLQPQLLADALESRVGSLIPAKVVFELLRDDRYQRVFFQTGSGVEVKRVSRQEMLKAVALLLSERGIHNYNIVRSASAASNTSGPFGNKATATKRESTFQFETTYPK